MDETICLTTPARREYPFRVQKRNRTVWTTTSHTVHMKQVIGQALNSLMISAHSTLGMLEDPAVSAPTDMWTRTNDPLTVPNEPIDVSIHFSKGLPTKIVVDVQTLEHKFDGISLPNGTSGQKSSSHTITDGLEIFLALNEIGKVTGCGRCDIIEDRFIGLKSRGVSSPLFG